MSTRGAHPPLLWAAVALAAGLAGPLLPWTVSALALLGAAGAAALRSEAARPFAAGLVALAGAPLWLSLGGAGSPLGARALTAASALVVLLTCQPIVPRKLPWIVLLLGLVEAGRQAAAGQTLPAALPGAAALALAGLGLAGATAGAARGRPQILALAVVGVVGLGRAGQAARAAPSDVTEVHHAAALGVLRLHADALAATPALALEALRADPGQHGLALALLPTTPLDALLATGWRAEQAPLDPVQRLALADALDALGEGGRAVRVLRPGRADPEVAWRHALMERQIGRDNPWEGPAPASLLARPTANWRLPGRVDLGWTFLSNGARTLDFHAEGPLGPVSLEARGQPLDGPAEIEVRLDHAPPVVLKLPEAPAQLPVAGSLSAGPHRLRVRFLNDAQSALGDRNAQVTALIAAAR